MSAKEFLFSAWSWPPAMLPACALLLGVSWAAWGAHKKATAFATERLASRPSRLSPRWRWGFWAAALVVFSLALVSPLGVLAGGYLFSAHMLQHLLLLLVVPALYLLGWPHRAVTSFAATNPRGDELREPLNREPRGPRPSGEARRDRVSALATHPGLTWLAGVGAMWLWHAPTLCNAATTSQGVRALQIVSLLVLGTLFWWPILGPDPRRRLAPLTGAFYLFTACVGCTLLGIFITFTPLSVCSAFEHPADPWRVLPLIRQQWGFTPAVDQQVGGLIMWVPACLIYLTAIMTLLLRWFAGYEATPHEGAVRSPA